MACFLALSLLDLLVWSAHATDTLTVPVRSQDGELVDSPQVQRVAASLGLRLDAIHTLSFDGALLHERRLVRSLSESDGPLFGGRRLTTDLTRRDIVRLCLKLNILAYPDQSNFSDAMMQPILAAGDSLFGTSVRTLAEERDSERAYRAELLTEFNSSGQLKVATGGFNFKTESRQSIGVHALEFTHPTLGKILVFRGTFSSGDEGNILLWIADWVTGQMTSMMEYQWLNSAKLPWGQKQQENKARINNKSDQMLTQGLAKRALDFIQVMKGLAAANNVDASAVAKTAYWEFTKVIAESVRSSLNGSKLLITGHSQGGAQAAITSMYFERKYGVKYETITFAGVGGQCFPRNFSFTDGNMLADVNPYIYHDQIVEYVHPLDIYGWIDIDPGMRCVYGTSDVATSRSFKYCQELWGNSAADLFLAEAVGNVALQQQFLRCRYLTHNILAMAKMLNNDSYLFEDGTTDGRCEQSRCNCELSKEACAISTSNSTVGVLNCVWSEDKCRSPGSGPSEVSAAIGTKRVVVVALAMTLMV